jgi:flagellar protein FliO/FliZ
MAPAISLRILIVPAGLLPVLSYAQTAAPATDLGGNLVQLLVGMGIVIALLFASLWLLKRLSAPRGKAAGLMRVIAGTSVGTRERVVVLEVAETWLVLGVAPGRITALAEIPRGKLPAIPEPAEAKDFPDRLRQLLDRGNAR